MSDTARVGAATAFIRGERQFAKGGRGEKGKMEIVNI